MVRPTVYMKPSRIVSFSNLRNSKTPALRFSADGKHLNTKLLENDVITIIMSIPCPRKSKLIGNCYVFKFLRHSVDRKKLDVFLERKSCFQVYKGPKLCVIEMMKTIGVAHRLQDKNCKKLGQVPRHYLQGL